MKKQYRTFKYTVASVFSVALVSALLPACEQGVMNCQVAGGKFAATLKMTSDGDNCLEKKHVVMNFDHFLGVTNDRLKRGNAKDARMGMSLESVRSRYIAAEKRLWALESYEKNCKKKDPNANVDVNPDDSFIKEKFYTYGDTYESYLPDASEKCSMKTYDPASLSIPALDAVPKCLDDEDKKKDDKKKRKKGDKKKKKKKDEENGDEENGDEENGDEEKGDEGKGDKKKKKKKKKDDEGNGDEENGDEENDERAWAALADDDHSKPIPAFEVSYRLKDVSVSVSPATQGNRVEGVLEYEEGGCSATYEFTAIWPLQKCSSTEDCEKNKKIGIELRNEGIECVKDKGAKSGFCALK